jgi:hypothetical protein
VDGHDWERVTFEMPKTTRSTPNPVPRETRKREHVTVNTVLDLDPKFDSFRIFLHNLDSQDQDEHEEALGDGLIFNKMSIVRPPTPGANNKKNREHAKLQFCLPRSGNYFPSADDIEKLITLLHSQHATL